MSKEYNEKTYAIDLIREFHSTSNIMLIKKTAKEVLKIDLTLSEIADYLLVKEDLEKVNNLVEYNINYNEDEYEWKE